MEKDLHLPTRVLDCHAISSARNFPNTVVNDTAQQSENKRLNALADRERDGDSDIGIMLPICRIDRRALKTEG